jgi:hypothetical protein
MINLLLIDVIAFSGWYFFGYGGNMNEYKIR